MPRPKNDAYNKYQAPTQSSHSAYYERGNWRCNGSPSGAHIWLNQQGDLWRCQYCPEERHWSNALWSEPENLD